MRDIALGLVGLIVVCVILQMLEGLGWIGVLLLLGFGAWYMRAQE